jgi:drug/metabolite transporter (DMT)-like permease
VSSSRSSRWLLVAAAALFSTGGAAIKLCALAPWQVACLRSSVAAAVLFALMPGAGRGWSLGTLLVGASFAATMLLFVLANRLTTAASTTFLQSTAPLYVLLLAPWLLGERLTRADALTLAAMALGLTGLLLDPPDDQATAPRPELGNALAALAGLSWALTMIGLRGLTRAGRSPDAAVVAGSVIAALVALPFALPLALPSTSDWAVVLWLGTFQIGLAYVCMGRGLRQVSAMQASLLLLVEPVLAPVWAWIVHGERVGAWTLAGGALILGATLARTLSERV